MRRLDNLPTERYRPSPNATSLSARYVEYVPPSESWTRPDHWRDNRTTDLPHIDARFLAAIVEDDADWAESVARRIALGAIAFWACVGTIIWVSLVLALVRWVF